MLCGDCYFKEVESLQKQEKEKVAFYEYLKKLFGKTSCPEPVKNAVDWALRDGKSLTGIRFTVYYYYEVLANSPENISEVQWIIRDYYEEAKSYAQEMNELGEYNRSVNIVRTPTQLKIKKPSSQKRLRRKIITED